MSIQTNLTSINSIEYLNTLTSHSTQPSVNSVPSLQMYILELLTWLKAGRCRPSRGPR